MKQDDFEARYRVTWNRFETWLRVLRGGNDTTPGERADAAKLGVDYPRVYRQVCHHLALARARRYSTGLQQRLNQLALDGHQYLYRERRPVWTAIGRFFIAGFPAAFRRRWRFMLASAALFVVPGVAMAIAIQVQPELLFSLIEPHQVSSMESMYDPDRDVLGRERDSASDFQMFGFYIYNNITIGFQTYAGGLLFGLGSVFYLVFNGLFIGAVASHLTGIGYVETFWTFVAGHSSLELTAIVIFGGVGLMLGYSAIAPGRKRRWHAIRDEAVASMPLVYGATAMLIGAAFVEAYWSSTTWPPPWVKYGVGIAGWAALSLYFAVFGRHES